MLDVLCFDCGGMFKVPYGTKEPTKKCPKCFPPDWCDDCVVVDSICTICGYTHGC